MLRKLDPFQPLIVTATYFDSYINTPQLINQGMCWQWAYLAHKTFKDVELWDTCDHAFVRYQGKFYDSQKPFGEYDWRNLPAAHFGSIWTCSECKIIGRQGGAALLTEQQFRDHWQSQTKRYNITFTDLDQKAEQELRRRAYS
jgi:hypothetical protein